MRGIVGRSKSMCSSIFARSVRPTAGAMRPHNIGKVLSEQAARGGAHDFDFEFGEWTAHVSVLADPSSGANDWVDYQGTSVVRRVWGGRANLGELNVEGPEGRRIEGLSLRLFDPGSGQWRIHWANSRDGELGAAMVGGFRDGIGEFYNQEILDGRPILVRFVFSELTEATFRLEQAFSDDDGETWEANWIARFNRIGS